MEPIFNHQLLVRVISALSLLPIALAAIWFGGIWFDCFLTAGLLIMSAEWCHITQISGRLRQFYMFLSAGLGGFIIFLMPASFAQSYALYLLLFPLLAACASLVLDKRQLKWSVIGILYLAIAMASFHWLRQMESGIWWTFWSFLMVWAMDVGGFFAGRSIGGPKLAPRLSPNKTWSGLLGGMGLAVAASFVFQSVLNLFPDVLTKPFHVDWYFAAVLAAIAQCGDLAESAVKRHFNVKDAGGMIPGHGGLLDRADGLLTAGPAVLIWLTVFAA